MKNTPDQKSKISTPKKVALAILGALTLLTLVNLIEAGVGNQNHDALYAEEERRLELELEALAEIEEKAAREEAEFDFQFHVNVGDEKVDITVKEGTVTQRAGDVAIEEEFEVSPGELLSVLVGDADININTHEHDVVHVKISLDGKNMDKAWEYFENQNYEVMYREGAVFVHTNPIKKNYGWDNEGAQIVVDLDIPSTFHADIKTSDGDISLRSLEGDVSLHTSDGDIRAEEIVGSTVDIRTSDGDITSSVFSAGKISLRTSDGDIKVEDLTSEKITISTSDGDIWGNTLDGITAVSTSDGDIKLENVFGQASDLRTSDGEIVIKALSTDFSKIQSSDGSINLSDVSGELVAKTSSGDLRISLLDATNVDLRAGDGNIQVEVPKDYAATLYLKGDRVRVSSEFSLKGEIKDDEADGEINGGGYTFKARASDGEVIFREN